MYKKDGVTLIILAVTVIVALTLLSTIIFSYSNIKSSMKKREFAKEIYTVQKLSDEYYLKNNKYATAKIKYTFTGLNSAYLNQFSGSDSTSELLELDLYEIGAEEVARGIKRDGDNLDIYVVSPLTGKVYYVKGENVDGKIYYSLTYELEKLIK